MSHKLVNLNPDLKRLRDEGYEIDVINGHLVVRAIPYVTAQKTISSGVLVTPLDLAGEATVKPQDHVIYFKGDHPCDRDGNQLGGIQHSVEKNLLTDGVEVDRSFSNKPSEGFADYYEKVTNYVRIIAAHAESIDPKATPRTHRVVETPEAEAVFNYVDANTSRAGIDEISRKLEAQKIGVVGLGGTGSYVLDFVAKTPVGEIHLFDHDDFLTHNAFRAPGAPSVDTLNSRPKKAGYLREIYAKMHKHIQAHEYSVDASNVAELSELDFVFVCIDDGMSKKIIIDALVATGTAFVDVGMGVNIIDGSLTGSLRVTAFTHGNSGHLSGRIPMSEEILDDEYSQNIQIAELNALNAALAVIRWKKMLGYYHDLESEHNSVFVINTNQLVNDETIS